MFTMSNSLMVLVATLLFLLAIDLHRIQSSSAPKRQLFLVAGQSNMALGK